MQKVKVIAMYLPQYHETEENNKWWGQGFTDWTSVKAADVLYENHKQPRVPLNERYYDLTDADEIKWQADIAKKYGVYGFGIYHYWFSTNQRTLTKPAEILLQHEEIDMPFFLAWDNNSWVRTWSKFQHNTNAWSPKIDAGVDEEHRGSGILAKLEYGTEADWKIHFDYLNQFFMDSRYIKVNNKPFFVIWNYTQKDTLRKMCVYWNQLAVEAGYDGLYLVSRLNPYDSMECFDALFTYEPMFSAWQNKNILNRVINKVCEKIGKNDKLTFYNYDKVWKAILDNAKKTRAKNVMYGGFVGYDDTPRRGIRGKVVRGGSPEKFGKYLKELLDISSKQNKEYIYITAWNEWGEGAYLEPDEDNGYKYLEELKKAIEEVNA